MQNKLNYTAFVEPDRQYEYKLKKIAKGVLIGVRQHSINRLYGKW